MTTHASEVGKAALRRGAVVVWLLVVAAAAAVPYASSLGGEFVLDDRELIVNNPTAHSLSNFGTAFTSHFLYGYQRTEALYYRPLVVASYQLNYALSGANPAPFRATNLLLNVMAALLVFAIARRLTGSLLAAGVAGVAFAVLPSHAESVAWISGRTDVLAAVFGLASFYVFMCACQRRSGFDWRLGTLCSVLFACALLSKEIALVLPALFLAHAWISGTGLRRREAVRWISLLAPPLVVYLLLRHHALGVIIDTPASGALQARMLRFGAVYATYLRMLFVPQEIRVYYGDLAVGAGLTAAQLAAWSAPAGLVALSVWARKRLPVIAFGAAWVFLSLLPAADAVPSRFLLPADRFVYLASAGSALVFGWIAWKAFEWRPRSLRTLPAAIALLVLGYTLYSASMTVCSSRHYKTNLDWARRIARVDPPHEAFRTTAASFFDEAGCYGEGLGESVAAMELAWDRLSDDERARLTYSLGQAYIGLGDMENARVALLRSAAADPSSGDTMRSLGGVSLQLGRFDEASKAYERLRLLARLSARDHLALGLAYRGMGDTEKAKREFRQVITDNPGTEMAELAARELSSIE